MEKQNYQSTNNQDDKINVKHQSTKTNINLNYDNDKVLILEMETDNHEIKDKLIITSSGLIGSQRTKKDNSEDDNLYFGAKEPEEEPVNNIIFNYLYIGWKNRLLFTYFNDKISRNKR